MKIDIERIKEWTIVTSRDAVHVENERMRLKKILSDNNEYNRLMEIFSFEHNVYDKTIEAGILRELNSLLLKGYSSSYVNEVIDIERARAAFFMAQAAAIDF